MQLYTIKQVAEKLCISERAVNGMLIRRELAYIDVCTSPSGKKPRKRIREDDLMAFLNVRRKESREHSHVRRKRTR